MLLIDDILLFPVKSLCFIFREIHNAVKQEAVQETEDVHTKLRELYMMLETDQISEDEFDAHEKELLDYLDRLENSE
ncbi:MAG: gas vesicle protein GvpG [Verrucomicrobia bacterium]|nr:gas vesicle protein GvpG [Verrucomicrobiota bacterium]MCF7707515.1 gas vesicle protein GvpG [Verrucomicrobiota bacterium]